jgi:hypothetical protein
MGERVTTTEGEHDPTTIPTQRDDVDADVDADADADADVAQDVEERPAAEGGGFDLQNAATIGAVGLALFTLLKAYAAAKFSLTTAAALLTTAPLSVFLGTMVSYSYQIFPLLALAAVTWLRYDHARSRVWGPANWAALVVAVLALLVSPWRYLVLSAGVLGSLVLLCELGRWLLDRRGKDLAECTKRVIRALTTTSTWIAVFFVAAGVFVILRTLTNVWLPVEVVVYQQGADCTARISHVVRPADNKQLTSGAAEGCRATVGHVLDDEGDWTTIVRAEDRGLVRIPSGDVRYRELCHLSGVQPTGERPLLWVLSRQPYRSPNTSCDLLARNMQGAELDPGSLPA